MSEEVRRVKRDVTSQTPVTVVGSKMTNDIEQLLAYVNQKIKLMANKLLFDGNRSPSLYELNKAIAEWPHVYLALTVSYEEAAYELDIAKEAYEEFLNDKIVETRETYNRNTVEDKKFWLGSKEIEAYTCKKYKNELAHLKAAIILCERQKSTMLRIIDGWNNYSWQLNQLSKNSIAETAGDLRASKSDYHPND